MHEIKNVAAFLAVQLSKWDYECRTSISEAAFVNFDWGCKKFYALMNFVLLKGLLYLLILLVMFIDTNFF